MMARRGRSPATGNNTPSTLRTEERTSATAAFAETSQQTQQPQPLIPNFVMDPRRNQEVRVDESVIEPDYGRVDMAATERADVVAGDQERGNQETVQSMEAGRTAQTSAGTSGARGTRAGVRTVLESTEQMSEAGARAREESEELVPVERPAALPLQDDGAGIHSRAQSEREDRGLSSVTSRVSLSEAGMLPPLPSAVPSDRASSRGHRGMTVGDRTPSVRSREDRARESRLEGLLESMASAISHMGERLQDLEERRSSPARSRRSSVGSRDSSLVRAQLEGMRFVQTGGLTTPQDSMGNMLPAIGYPQLTNVSAPVSTQPVFPAQTQPSTGLLRLL